MKHENPWGYIRVPREFKDYIESFIQQHPELGYASVREFMTDAVREKLKELQRAQEVEA